MQIETRRSPNHAPRQDPIDTLVLHYTGMADAAAALQRLCDPSAQVSAHYVVLEDGTVVQLVDDERVAWHAGASTWRGRHQLNATSIGIEIVNGGHDFGLPPYPEPQIVAVTRLSRILTARWSIPSWNVVAHSDIAPMRKQDPGERFPWSRLAAEGVGLWPLPGSGPAADDVVTALTTIGYGLEAASQGTSLGAVVRAFQRRFVPVGAFDGRMDAPTRQRLGEVARAYALAEHG